MQRFITLFLITVFSALSCLGQNLVLNPSFETTVPMCPAPFPGAGGALNSWDGFTGGATPPVNWYNPTYCTPDYFTPCAATPILQVPCGGLGALGYQQPRTGIVYAGLIATEPGPLGGGEDGWREYLQGTLSPPTTVGKTYEISFWVSRPNAVGVATDGIGCILTPNQIVLPDSQLFPQPGAQILKHTSVVTDTTNWVKICTTWVATNAMNYITIGNFNPKNSGFVSQSAPASGGIPQPFAYLYVEDVSVVEVQPATISLPVAICGGASTTLTASGGSGYTWTPGNMTTPSVSVSPTQTTTYTVAIERSCTITTLTVTVTVNSAGNITGMPATLCNTAAPVTLTGTPAGGTFSGPGMTGSSFNPATAGVGTHTITYSGVSGGCNYSTTVQAVVVNSSPAAFVNPPTTLCSNAAPVTLNATPAGGTFSGPGVSGASFNPATAGVGTHIVTYSGTNGCGSISTTTQIVVQAGQTVTFTPPTTACVNGSPISLTASPAGGTFSGPGVTGSTFNPTTAGSGTKTITYTVNTACGPATVSANISVGTGTVPTVGLNSTYCLTDPIVTLSPNPTGQSYTFAGPGITNATYVPFIGILQDPATFNPATAGVGTHTITYNGPNMCPYSIQITVLNSNPTATITPVSPLCSSSAPVTLSATPAGGTFSGTGVSGGQFNPSGLAPGNYTVTYSGSVSCGSFSTTTSITVGAITVSSTNSNPNICPGNSSILTASGATTYSWAPNTGLSATTGASVTATPSNTTTYTVTGTSNGCAGTSTVTVTVQNNLTVSATAATSTLCPGNNTSLTASGATTYNWAPNTGLSSTSGASVTATPSNTTTYTVTGTSNGCTGTSTVTVTVQNNLTVSAVAATPTLCNGSNTSLTASGAATYAWAPNTGLSATTGTTVTATPTSTTTYTITGTQNGCTGTSTVTVTVNPKPTVSVVAASPTLCPGANTTLTSSGATSYAWAPATGLSATSGASVTANPNVSTVYTVTGTTNGCSNSATVAITISPTPAVTASTNAANLCPNASATLTGSGANTYLWNPGNLAGALVNVTPAATTTYTVTGTNAGGCTNTATVLVTVNPNPTITASTNKPSICLNGSANLTATGGATYSWAPAPGLSSTSGASVTANPTVSTVYTVTGTSATGCSNTATVSISINPNPSPSITGSTTICSGQTQTLGVNGSFATYQWSTGENTATVTKGAGTFTVTVTDANGCTGTSAAFVVTSANSLSPTISGNNTICAGQNTTLSAPAGFASYSWSPGGQNTQTISVGAGTYTVSVSDASGCSGTSAPFSVSIAPPLTPTITGSTTLCAGQTQTLGVSGSFTNYLWSSGETSATITKGAGTFSVTVTNANGCTGSASITVVAGTSLTPTISGANSFCTGQSTTLSAPAGFSYSWAPNGQTSQTINVNSAGTFTVTVTDAGGCTGSASTTVSQNPLPSPTIQGSGTLCAGQTQSLSVSGSFANYLWNTGENTAAVTKGAGTFTVVVTDANGCVNTSPAFIVTNANGLSPTISGNNTVCAGQTTTLSAPAGFASYSWSPGGQTAQTINVGAGTFSVSVTDAGGCSGTSAPFIVSVGSGLAPSIIGLPTVCVGQTQTLSVSGSFANYLWNTGETGATINQGAGTFSVTVTDAGGCTGSASITVTNAAGLSPTISGQTNFCVGQSTNLSAPAGFSYLWSPGGQTSQNLNVNAAGTYTVTVTDAGGCTGSASAIVVENPAPVPVISGSNTLCFGQTQTLSVGGTFASYSWSTGENTPTVVKGAGMFAVTVTDANGCVGTSTAFAVTSANGLSPNITGPTQICTGEQATLSAPAGLASYLWSNGQSTQTVTVGAGNYTVTVDNGTGCTGSAAISVTLAPAPLADFSTSAVCEGQSLSFNAAGSVGTIVSYEWDFNGDSQSDATGVTAQNLFATAGQYPVRLIVTTDKGCADTVTKNAVVKPQPVADFTAPDFICKNGEGTITYTGVPVPQQTLTWNFNGANVTPTGNETYQVKWPLLGTYTVSLIVKSLGCADTLTKTIQVTSIPIADAGKDFLICEGESVMLEGTILNPSGTGSCQYIWSSPNIATLSDPTILTPIASPLQTTKYILQSICNGCVSKLDSVVVKVRQKPGLFIQNNEIELCEGTGGVVLNTSVTGGTPPYIYHWSPTPGLSDPFSPNPIANPADTTLYTLYVTDSAGCKSNDQFVLVNLNAMPKVRAGDDVYLCLDGNNSVQLNANVANGGFGSYSIRWVPSTGLSDSTIFNPVATPTVTTIYTAIVTNNVTNCSSSATTLDTAATVTVYVLPPPIAVAAPTDTVKICFNDSIMLGGLPIGGGPNYTYEWTPGAGLSDSTIRQPFAKPGFTTTYQLKVTSNGCASSADIVTVVVNPRPSVALDSLVSVCPNDKIQLKPVVQNGTPPITYLWAPAAGLSSTTVAEPFASPSVTTTYTLRVFADGCESPEQKEIIVAVLPTAKADLRILGQPTTVCAAALDSVQLNAVIIPPVVDGVPATVTYRWIPTEGLSDTTSVAPKAHPAETRYYKIEVKVVGTGCTVVDSVLVRVLPKVIAEAASSRDTICQGDVATIGAKGGIGSANYNWFWTDTTGATGVLNGKTLEVSPVATTTYILEVSEGGCTDRDTINIFVKPGAAPAFETSTPNGCAGRLTVGFLNLTTGSPNGYQWDFGDGSPLSNVENPNHTYSEPGVYTVNLIALSADSCEYAAPPKTIRIEAPAVPEFISDPLYNSGDTLFLPNATVTFTNQSVGAVSYLWQFGDSTSSAEINPTHTYLAAGNYTVKLNIVDPFGCVYSVEHGIYLVQAPIYEIPNVFTPNGDGVNDYWKPKFNGSPVFTYSIFDRWGNQLYSGTETSVGWNGQSGGGKAAPGQYFYLIKLNGDRNIEGGITLVR